MAWVVWLHVRKKQKGPRPGRKRRGEGPGERAALGAIASRRVLALLLRHPTPECREQAGDSSDSVELSKALVEAARAWSRAESLSTQYRQRAYPAIHYQVTTGL